MTIEERVQEILKVGEKYSSSEYKNVYKNAYIKGATDQRKIDVDKACEWLEEHLNDDFTKRVSIDDFRKAMEG